jgi:hypothetical protein
MTSLPEISVVRMPTSPEGMPGVVPHGAAWSPPDAPRSGRFSPVTLVVLALLAGIGAMVLGALAVLSATRQDAATTAISTPAGVTTGVERRVLALLAKPSTERVVFRGSGGNLVLAVGSGGRAAILVRGNGNWPSGTSFAWVLRSGKALRTVRLTAPERAAFLPVPLLRGDSVAVAADRAAALRQGPRALIAVRG